ncbi:hypothetical protein QE152_g32530 [Popillia japonica]|uniref:Uncharacterized protein n=1 Tax=Popillia japonica TaxID=7064 RepID=A0AAW1IZB2_POPJA
MGQRSSKSDLTQSLPIKPFHVLEKRLRKRGSAKKQREVVRVTQVLTAAKLSPKTNNRNSNEVKKTPVPPVPNDVKITNRKNLFASKDKKKEISPKDLSGRG